MKPDDLDQLFNIAKWLLIAAVFFQLFALFATIMAAVTGQI